MRRALRALLGPSLPRSPIVVVFALAILDVLAHSVGLLAPIERIALDLVYCLPPKTPARNVRVVEIGEWDYAKVFDATSPLDPSALLRLLEMLASADPAVIGVDIVTDHHKFKPLQEALHTGRLGGTRLVFMQSAEATTTFRWFPPRFDVRIRSHGLLGSPTAQLHGFDGRISWGPSFLPVDPDGIVRRYFRTYPTVETKGGKEAGNTRVRSFYWETVQAFCEASTSSESCSRIRAQANDSQFLEETPLLAYGRLPPSIGAPVRAGVVLGLLPGSPGRDWRSDLKGKIVLVGGSYSAGHDDLRAPSGPATGVQVLAEAIETEIERGGVAEPSKVVVFLVQLAAGVLFFLVSWRWAAPGTGAFLVFVPAFLVASLVVSWACMLSIDYWVSLVPLLFSLGVHRLYDEVQGRMTLERQLAELRERVEDARQEQTR